MKQQLPASIAAVDLGSSSFHLVVADTVNGHLKVVDRLREMVRLGSGLDAANRLVPDVAERALRCLERFGERVRHLPHGAVRVVGTNTLRKARNAQDFLRQAEAALGHSVDVISGHEEARLIFLGVSHGLADDGDVRLVIDIGGGSTEVILGRRFEPLYMESLHTGCVTMSDGYFGDGTIDAKRMRHAEIVARQEFEPVEAEFRGAAWQSAIGTSGTILAIRSVLVGQGWSDDAITREGLEKLRAAVVAAKHVDALAELGVAAERRPVFPGGLAILLGAFEEIGIEQMRVADSALREGLLYDLLGRIHDEDVRDRTIEHLCERHHVDRAQAARVNATAQDLFAKVAPAWDLDRPGLAQLLAWAAALHEIGQAISHSQYHKHGAYLLRYLDMPGFARGEQIRLATLVRGHRRKVPLPEFTTASEAAASELVRLCVILRLAVVLHRRRSADALPEFTVKADGESIRLAFPKGWLDAHPLTSADLEQEAAYLRPAGFKLRLK
ncbi:MAG: exopolyphosphatase [Gammaproteobacteria bacterium]|nr:exopolyphosphatase [Gammaproteobacteria bacterium]MBI5616828.1 exopolyphosphatase [Gammaproteobacteria bacterium]